MGIGAEVGTRWKAIEGPEQWEDPGLKKSWLTMAEAPAEPWRDLGMGKAENDFPSCQSNLSGVLCYWAHDSLFWD